MKIVTKLKVLGLAVLAVICVLFAFTYNGFNKTRGELEQLNNERFYKYQHTASIGEKVKTANSWLYQIANDVNRERPESYIDERVADFKSKIDSIQENLVIFKVDLNKINSLNEDELVARTGELENLLGFDDKVDSKVDSLALREVYLAELIALYARLYDIRVEAIMPTVKLMKLIGAEMAAGMMAGTENYYHGLLHGLEELKQLEIDLATKAYDNSIRTYITTKILLLSISFAGLLLITLLLTSISLGITKPLGNLVKTLHDIAEGDGNLTARLPEKGNDELTEVATAFNKFSDRINSLVVQVKGVVGKLDDISSDVSGTTQETSGYAHDQLSRLQQVESAVQELTSFSEKASDASALASRSSQTARSQAQDAVECIDASITDMEKLASGIFCTHQAVAELSKNTGNVDMILDMIRNIAEQTNLLALNASIEAARAGEQGRGFAVVADEVRNLAQRSSEAAGQIQGVVSEIKVGTENAAKEMGISREMAQHIIKQAASVTDSIATVVSGIEENHSHNSEISQKTVDQARFVSEINQHVQSISLRASKTVELSTAGQALGGTLAQESAVLSQLISRFKT